MIWVTDDPEQGYFDDDHVWLTPYGLRAVDEDGEVVGVAVPADCSICEGPIPEDALVPLCDSCNATARAHARLERDRREAEGRVG